LVDITNAAKRVERSLGVERGYVPEQTAKEWCIKHAENIRDMMHHVDPIKDVRRDDISRELASLLINTLCTCNQYMVNIPRAYHTAGIDGTIHGAMEKAGQRFDNVSLAEISNELCKSLSDLTETWAFYWGWGGAKKPRPMGSSIAEIHTFIYAIAHRYKLNLSEAVDQTLHTARSADPHHSDVFHPSISRANRE